MSEYAQRYDQFTGRFLGVRSVAGVEIQSGGHGWREFLAWNAAQRPPLDLSDLAPPPRRRPRSRAAIKADLDALPPGRLQALRQKVLDELLVEALQRDPQFVRRLGEPIDGDEPV